MPFPGMYIFRESICCNRREKGTKSTRHWHKHVIKSLVIFPTAQVMDTFPCWHGRAERRRGKGQRASSNEFLKAVPLTEAREKSQRPGQHQDNTQLGSYTKSRET